MIARKEAEKKWCPFRLTKGDKCQTINCMAWEEWSGRSCEKCGRDYLCAHNDSKCSCGGELIEAEAHGYCLLIEKS